MARDCGFLDSGDGNITESECMKFTSIMRGGASVTADDLDEGQAARRLALLCANHFCGIHQDFDWHVCKECKICNYGKQASNTRAC